VFGVIWYRGTVDGCGATGAAWVQADQIEPHQHRLGEPRQQERGVLESSVTRATRIEDQRPDPIRLLLVSRPDDLQRDLFALRVGIVEWDRELSARQDDLGGKIGCELAKL
jgi:hypothetical protein